MKKILFSLLLTTALVAHAETLTENFTADPATHGWQTFGDASLFHWDATNHNLAVTWDSSQTNSYFYHPLATTLGEQDGFNLAFDLTLSSAVSGGDNGFEIAVGLFHLADATSTNFFRGTGYQSPNLIEFNYFPPFGIYGASIDATMEDTDNNFKFLYDDTQALTNGVTYRVALNHVAGDTVITAAVYTYATNGQLQLYSSVSQFFAYGDFSDFFVDTISISSYNDTGAYGSISAQGVIDNLVVTTSPRPVGNITGQTIGPVWQAQFTTRTNWLYTLERSADLKTWTPVSTTTNGNGSTLTLQDPHPPATQALYRVHAQQ